MDVKIKLHVNGEIREIVADPATPLIYILRNQLSLNGPKYGCGIQLCGACMILVNGRAETSCTTPVGSMANKPIITLEGLTQPGGRLHPVQEAFVSEQAAQCGYCLNGMVMSAVSLLKENTQPSDREIRAGLERSLCRCSTHTRIIKAVKRAAAGKTKPVRFEF